jgi:hypothetical protein
MKILMMATLGAALLSAMVAAQAGGKVGGDPSVTRSAKGPQVGSGGTTKPRDTSVGTQPVQKTTGEGTNSGTRQRGGLESNGTHVQGTDLHGIESNGTDVQGTDAQATQPPPSISHQLDTLTLRGEPLVDVRLVEGELTARTARQVLLPGR